MANMFRGAVNDYNKSFSKQLTDLKLQVLELIKKMKAYQNEKGERKNPNMLLDDYYTPSFSVVNPATRRNLLQK